MSRFSTKESVGLPQVAATASAAAGIRSDPGLDRAVPPASGPRAGAIARNSLALEPSLLLLDVPLRLPEQGLGVEQDPVLDGPGHAAVLPLLGPGDQPEEPVTPSVHHLEV